MSAAAASRPRGTSELKEFRNSSPNHSGTTCLQRNRVLLGLTLSQKAFFGQTAADILVRVCAQCNPIMRFRVRELGRIDHLCYVPGCNPKCPRLRAGNEKVSLGLPARRAVGR